MRSLESILSSDTFSLPWAPGFTVEKAMKMSPEPSLLMPPTLDIPRGTRRASRFSW